MLTLIESCVDSGSIIVEVLVFDRPAGSLNLTLDDWTKMISDEDRDEIALYSREEWAEQFDS